MAERLDIADLGELTLGEMELIETHTGVPLSRLQADAAKGGEGVYRVKFARAMGLIVLRRRARAAGAPDPTWEDTDGLLLPALSALEAADVDAAGEVGTTAPDPTEAATAGRRKRRG